MVVPHIAPRRRAAAGRSLMLLLGLGLLPILNTGCQTSTPVTNRRLIEHQALIDFSGLKPVEAVEAVQVTCSVPRNWTALEPRRTALYAHQQWKSPSTTSGVGVVHVKLPIPLSEKMILWLAKREYTSKANDGRAIREWTDAVGRSWFEAENKKYHVQGYVLSRGRSAWLVYFGYKTGYAPDMAELSVAARAAETFVPLTGANAKKADEAPAKSDEPSTASAK